MTMTKSQKGKSTECPKLLAATHETATAVKVVAEPSEAQHPTLATPLEGSHVAVTVDVLQLCERHDEVVSATAFDREDFLAFVLCLEQFCRRAETADGFGFFCPLHHLRTVDVPLAVPNWAGRVIELGKVNFAFGEVLLCAALDHHMPTASMKRRIAHCLYQVVWTQGDNGKGMVNYADLGGFAIDDAIGNLYIPGRETNVPSSARRYGAALATAPIDNFITEFVPDIARRIHVRVVIIQQIINQVARSGGTGPS